ncbi:MAG: phosphoadenosine phosphosulfate reductase family protein [Planctomycetota bacterium]
MIKALSYGGGVNSTAILALIKLGEYPMPDRIIFCDTGAEREETYCYMRFMQKQFPTIETIKSKRGGLIEYCDKYKVIPARMTRWCTINTKIKPFQDLFKGIEHIKILGIANDESHRVRDTGEKTEYPLIEKQMTRDDCINIIREVGWDVPIKSGCFICPFMRIAELRALYKRNGHEWETLVRLEKQANDRNKKIFFRGNKLLTDWIKDRHWNSQEIIDGFENYQHCLCKFD